MSETKNDRALNWLKVLVPVIVMLLGSEGWQYYAAPGKIKDTTGEHVDKILVTNLSSKLDSIAFAMASKEFAKNSLEQATAEIKNLDGQQARKYLSKVFQLADRGLKNDSAWRYIQLPFIIKEMNKRYLCPYEDLTTGSIIMQGLGGEYSVREGKPAEMQNNGNTLENDIKFYYDNENHLTPLSSLKRPLYRRAR